MQWGDFSTQQSFRWKYQSSYFFCTNIAFCVDVITKETHLYGVDSQLIYKIAG